MEDIQYFFKREDLFEMRGYLTLDNEINASVYGQKNGKCYLSDITHCESITTCKSCSGIRDDHVILHTHPTIFRPFPTLSDINNVVSSKTIRNSIVLTQWGVWQIIKNGEKVSDLSDPNKGNFVNECFKRLAENTTKTYDEKHMEFITKYIGKINDQLLSRYECKIYFSSWDDIGDDDLLVK
jgi:hypothetical protein